jgi:hypothetical protein
VTGGGCPATTLSSSQRERARTSRSVKTLSWIGCCSTVPRPAACLAGGRRSRRDRCCCAPG